MEIVSTAPEQSFSFGRQLGQLLQEGSVLCLIGDLGAGKTLLVQGIAQGLGLNEEITSPTFTVMNVYEGTIPVYHFDLYRLESPEQLVDIGFDEYTNAGGIAIIEWPDKFPGFMPDSYLRI
jgi:tRNA threonylcarbamoyladenosine biosynthesis protein TsaE